MPEPVKCGPTHHEACACREAAMRAVVEAGGRLLARLHEVHADGRYQAVWQIHQAHCGPYSGPQYDKELDGLDAALTAWRGESDG